MKSSRLTKLRFNVANLSPFRIDCHIEASKEFFAVQHDAFAEFGFLRPIGNPPLPQKAADLRPGSVAELPVAAEWLMCQDECVPGSANLTLSLPVSAGNPQPDQIGRA